MMYTQTQLNEKAKAEFERGLAEGTAAATAAASTKATAEFERGKTEGAAAEHARIKGEAAMAEVKSLQAKSAAVDGDPVALAAKLTAYVAGEAAKGRRISLTQASAEIANAK
jgi:hypothetical protein